MIVYRGWFYIDDIEQALIVIYILTIKIFDIYPGWFYTNSHSNNFNIILQWEIIHGRKIRKLSVQTWMQGVVMPGFKGPQTIGQACRNGYRRPLDMLSGWTEKLITGCFLCWMHLDLGPSYARPAVRVFLLLKLFRKPPKMLLIPCFWWNINGIRLQSWRSFGPSAENSNSGLKMNVLSLIKAFWLI